MGSEDSNFVKHEMPRKRRQSHSQKVRNLERSGKQEQALKAMIRWSNNEGGEDALESE